MPINSAKAIIVPPSTEKVYDKLWIDEIRIRPNRKTGKSRVDMYVANFAVGEGGKFEYIVGNPQRYYRSDDIDALAVKEPLVAAAMRAILDAVEKIDAREAEKTEKLSVLAALDAEIKTLRVALSGAITTFSAATTSMNYATAKVAGLADQISKLQQHIAELTAERDTLASSGNAAAAQTVQTNIDTAQSLLDAKLDEKNKADLAKISAETALATATTAKTDAETALNAKLADRETLKKRIEFLSM